MNRKIISLALLMVLLLMPISGVLAETRVTNSVSATANTGGNSAGVGENVVTGDSSASAIVETIIDGVVVESNEKIATSSGEGSFASVTSSVEIVTSSPTSSPDINEKRSLITRLKTLIQLLLQYVEILRTRQ